MSEPRKCKLMGGPIDGRVYTLMANAFEATAGHRKWHRYEFSHKDGDFDIFNYQGVIER